MRHLQAHQSHLPVLIEDVRAGGLMRRGFVVHTGRIGLSLPMAGMLLLLLLHAGVASSQPAAAYEPTRRGGGGVLRFLHVEGPTLLIPHFAAAMKDSFACRLVHEPLAQWVHYRPCWRNRPAGCGHRQFHHPARTPAQPQHTLVSRRRQGRPAA